MYEFLLYYNFILELQHNEHIKEEMAHINLNDFDW